jgi:hypothetical protein
MRINIAGLQQSLIANNDISIFYFALDGSPRAPQFGWRKIHGGFWTVFYNISQVVRSMFCISDFLINNMKNFFLT